MTKILFKIKMKRIISLTCIIAVLFTVLIGSMGINTISKMTDDLNYLNSYSEYTKLLNTIKENVLLMESEVLYTSINPQYSPTENISSQNDIILNCIEIYDSTEYEEEIEKEHIDNVKIHYDNFFNKINDYISSIKSGQVVGDFNPSIKTELMENIYWLIDYVSYWNSCDFESAISLSKMIKIKYSFILLVSISLFTLIAINVVRFFTKEINDVNNALKEISTGNLNLNLEYNDFTEFDNIKSNITSTISSFKNIILDLKDKSNHIDERAEILSNNSVEFTSSAQNISSEIEIIVNEMKKHDIENDSIIKILDNFSDQILEFISSLNILNKNSHKITENAGISSLRLDEMHKTFINIKELVQLFMIKIDNLDSYIKEISGTAELINEIAEQTNLLALNASIESARVGEAGKGFAIVANEISNLAEQSRESSNNISALIERISTDTNNIILDGNILNDNVCVSVEVINESLNLFKEIINSTYDIDKKIKTLNTASETLENQKNLVKNKVNESLNISKNILISTEKVVDSLDYINTLSANVSETSVNLNNLTNDMNDEIQFFNTSSDCTL